MGRSKKRKISFGEIPGRGGCGRGGCSRDAVLALGSIRLRSAAWVCS